MPRAPYDTTCDLYYGPSGLIPNTKYATTNCRVVPLTAEFPQLYPLSLRTAYITMDIRPNQAKVGGVLPSPNPDWDFADRIAVPTGGLVNYMVLFSEQVLWRTHSVYYRTSVQPVPPPPPHFPIWKDTFTEVVNTNLSVHVPNLGSGGYLVDAGSLFCFGGINAIDDSLGTGRYFFDPGQVMTTTTFDFVIAPTSCATDFFFRSNASFTQSWNIEIVGPGIGSVLNIYKDGVFMGGTTFVGNAGPTYTCTITDDGTNITASVGLSVAMVSSIAYALNTGCGIRMNSMGNNLFKNLLLIH